MDMLQVIPESHSSNFLGPQVVIMLMMGFEYGFEMQHTF